MCARSRPPNLFHDSTWAMRSLTSCRSMRMRFAWMQPSQDGHRRAYSNKSTIVASKSDAVILKFTNRISWQPQPPMFKLS